MQQFFFFTGTIFVFFFFFPKASLHSWDMGNTNENASEPPIRYELWGGWSCKFGTWEKVEPAQEPLNLDQKNWTVVTYNIWFVEEKMRIRNSRIFEILSKTNADVICLQEVTSTFVMQIIQQEWVKKNYFVSDVDSS